MSTTGALLDTHRGTLRGYERIDALVRSAARSALPGWQERVVQRIVEAGLATEAAARAIVARGGVAPGKIAGVRKAITRLEGVIAPAGEP